jgi:hypothetical protein
MDHDETVIAADFELSERLGREILEAGCTPILETKVLPRLFWTRTVGKWAVIYGEIVTWLETESEAV